MHFRTIALFLAAVNVSVSQQIISVTNQDEVMNHAINQAAINSEQLSTQSLSSVAPPYEPFDPITTTKCFLDIESIESYIQPCTALDIWGHRLMSSARSPVVEIRKDTKRRVNFTEFSDPSFRNRQVINTITGLVGEQTNSTRNAQPQTICYQSAVAVLKILWDERDSFEALNSDLPSGFMQDADGGPIRMSDCSKHRTYGLQLLRALDRYQRDCFAACFQPGDTISHCGFRQRLGDPFDGVLSNLSEPSPSAAVSRLRKCTSAGWFSPDAAAALANVFTMCSASDSCATLCSGDAAAAAAAARQSQYRALRDRAARGPAPDPPAVLRHVKPIATALAKLAASVPAAGTPLDAARYVDALANPATGRCPAYDQAMADALRATGGGLSPLALHTPSSALPPIRAVRDPPCLAALVELQRLCAGGGPAAALCARSFAPDVNESGAFDSCWDKGLDLFRPAVAAFNARCPPLGLPARPTHGPPRRYLLPREGGRIRMADCPVDFLPYLWAYLGIGALMWAVLLPVVAVARRRRLPWLVACDLSMDVCRSRAYTVAAALWLLCSFSLLYQTLLSRVPLRDCSAGLGGDGRCRSYFPAVVYLFLVALIWVAAFAWIMVGNNPRRHWGVSALCSAPGLLLSHALTALLAARLIDDADLRSESDTSRYFRIVEVALLCVLQASMDALYVVDLCVRPALGDPERSCFDTQRIASSLRYVKRMLSKQQRALKRRSAQRLLKQRPDSLVDARRVFVTCKYQPDDKISTARSVQKLLADTAGRSIDCFIVVSIVPHHGLEQGVAQCTAEVIVAKLCVTPADEAARRRLLESEIAAARDESHGSARAGDVTRLRAVLARLPEPNPPMGLEDALILEENLRSELFQRAIRDCDQGDRAETYWASTCAALRECARLSGNSLQNRSSKAMRAEFRGFAADFGVPENVLTVVCSMPQDKLCETLKELRNNTDSVRDTCKRIALNILEDNRAKLLSLLADDNLREKLKEGEKFDWVDLSGQIHIDRRSRKNEFSLVTSCLDAFHLDHFKSSTRNSQYLEPASADMIVSCLESKTKLSHSDTTKPPHACLVKISMDAPHLPQYEQSRHLLEEKKAKDEYKEIENDVAFIPSILLICVGIATIIILLEFSSSIAVGFNLRGWVSSMIVILSDVQIFAGEFATATLELMSCIDADVVQTLQTLTPEQYATELQRWPPLATAASDIARDPAVSGIIAGLEAKVTEKLQTALSEVVSRATKAAIGAFLISLKSNPGNVQIAQEKATDAAQDVAAAGVSEIITNITSDDALLGYGQSLPSVIAPIILRTVANLSRPEVVVTLPVIGSVLGCLNTQLGSSSVQNVINRGTGYVSTYKVQQTLLLKTISADPCRDNLDAYDCAEGWRSVYPISLEQRRQLLDITSSSDDFSWAEFHSLNQSAKPYALPKACRLYESLGCGSVLTLTVQQRSAEGWGVFLNTTRDLISSYLSPINDTLSYVMYYTEYRFFPCYITSHVFAFLCAILVSLKIPGQFSSRLIELRQGKHPYQHLLDHSDQSTYNSTTTPTLAGMVLATAYAQFYVSITQSILEEFLPPQRNLLSPS